MHPVLLLTDNSHFGAIASQISCPEDVNFDYIILSKAPLTEHHIPENDFKNIFNACDGKEVIILQVKGSQIIYLVEILLSKKELSQSHFIVLQSPLVDFYCRPSEVFFIDRAVRRKLCDYPVSFTMARPLTSYFIRQDHYIFSEKYHRFLLPEASFFSQLLSEQVKEGRREEITYFLPETLSNHSISEQPITEKLSLFFLPLFYFEIFKNRRFYKQWFEKNALMRFLKNTKKLQHKTLISTEVISKIKQPAP